jgi:hypothetical protein
VLLNVDIFFDASLALVKGDCDLGPYTAYFLSRWEETGLADANDIQQRTQCVDEGFIGSHDAFVFIPPLPLKVIKNTEIEMGSWGIENRN